METAGVDSGPASIPRPSTFDVHRTYTYLIAGAAGESGDGGSCAGKYPVGECGPIASVGGEFDDVVGDGLSTVVCWCCP